MIIKEKSKGVPIWHFCRYADTLTLVVANMPILPIFSYWKSPYMFADSRYAEIEKKCRYANIADADINIGTPLAKSLYNNSAGFIPQLMA